MPATSERAPKTAYFTITSTTIAPIATFATTTATNKMRAIGEEHECIDFSVAVFAQVFAQEPAHTVMQSQMSSRKCQGPGQQPRLTAKFEAPKWWPMVNQKPCTHLYRICRPDMDDLKFVEHEAMRLVHGSDKFAWHVLNAVQHGSNHRTPFWHASVSISAAQRWRAMADSGSQPSGSGNSVAIRIDIWEWFQAGTMPDHALIDLTSPAAQRGFFKKSFEDYSYNQGNALQAMRYAHQAKEVLLKWRGLVPLEYCEIVDEYNGEVLCTFQEALAHVREKGRNIMDSIAVIPFALSHKRDAAQQTVKQADSGSQPSEALPVPVAATLISKASLSSEVPPTKMPSRPAPMPSDPHPIWGLPISCPPRKWGFPQEPVGSTQKSNASSTSEIPPMPPRPAPMPSDPHPIWGFPMSAEAKKGRSMQMLDMIPPTNNFGEVNLDLSKDDAPPRRVAETLPICGKSDAQLADSAALGLLKSPQQMVEQEVPQQIARQEDSGSQPSKAPPDAQLADSAALGPEEAKALVEFVSHAKKQKLTDLKKSVSASTFAIMERVFALERKYVDDLTQLTQRNCRELQKSMVMDANASADLQGFDQERQAKRRQISAELRATSGFDEFRKHVDELLLAHGQALVSLGAAKVVHLLPASTTTKRAVEMAQENSCDPPASGALSRDSRLVGSQPSNVKYTDILSSRGYIQVPKNSRGRKPPSYVTELEKQECEETTEYDWAQWWMQIGGFKACYLLYSL